MDPVAELIALITDETDRKSAEALFAKYEPLRGGILRQADYDRLMNETKEKVKTAEETSQKWKTWADENVPKHEELLKLYDKEQKENQELKQRVEEEVRKAAAAAAAKGNGNGDGTTTIDPADITKRVMSELGGKPASKQEIESMVGAAVKQTAESLQKEFFEKTLPESMRWQGEMNDVQFQHRDEFGKPIDRQAFTKFMTENKLGWPGEAYEKFVSEARTQKRVTAEVEKRVAEEMAKRTPGTSDGAGTQELGPARTFLQGKAPKTPEGSRPGDGSLALLAADSLRAEGKF